MVSISGVGAHDVVQPTVATRPDAGLAALQSVLDGYVNSGKIPGVVVAVGHGDAPPTFLSAGHIADDPGAPAAGPDSLWRVYSMTKPITAMAAMKLVEEGKLKLDEPISDFIPAFKTMRVLASPATSLESRPATHWITVRELLTHTSGLTYQFFGTAPIFQDYARLGLLGGRVGPEASKAQPATLEQFADRVATVPLLSEPGTEWHYSISLDVLGRVIEVASGMPFGRFVQQSILDPLGMTSTFWTVPRAGAGRLATAYYWKGDQRLPFEIGASSMWLQPPLVDYGGSGLVSSARDYDRFLEMLANGGSVGSVRVLKPATVKLALSNLLPAGVQIVSNVTPAPVAAHGFGAGGELFLKDVPGGVHAGTYGWFGAAGSFAFIDPVKRLRVTAMVNYFPDNKWPLYADVVKALYQDSAQS
ncbi:beta-lactamase family protein [Hephaestia sp. CMS5P-6]|nr:serine hydrolase domain-containing protein [Hephaestia mangrovi]MBY8828866.1 beta-lactamase family protein [Hephaestia mangrovi]